MACLETCPVCGGSGCDNCDGTGGIVVSVNQWAGARGYPTITSLKANDAGIKTNPIKQFFCRHKETKVVGLFKMYECQRCGLIFKKGKK